MAEGEKPRWHYPGTCYIQGCGHGLHRGGVGATRPCTKGPVRRGKKLYDCAECGKSFSLSTDLCYQRIHTGEKSFICDTCGRGFSYNTNLHVHRRVHTGEKPFTCEECGKGFDQSSNLCIHQRVHIGEKLHKHEKCGKNPVK